MSMTLKLKGYSMYLGKTWKRDQDGNSCRKKIRDQKGFQSFYSGRKLY